MTNILEAIINIINNPILEIKSHYSGRNRANNVGEALENFVKDAFANTIQIVNDVDRIRKHNEVFSWLGNQNHPPDIMIREGDAIEVKKTQSVNSDLALNSSYPKSNMKSDSPMITQECRTCENWTEKDLIYCVGHTSDESVNSLWMVYGNIYAAKHETYQIIKQKITDGINEIPNVELAETNELGRVNRVDPLGITNLRIRGMWQIQNPRRVFNYLHTPTLNTFELVAIIPTDKYQTFATESRDKIENLRLNNLTITDVQVKDPNNPANLIKAKLIIFQIN
ncbi:MAG: NgoPII family restriction endonuclease [Bacteroidetes bacterium RIFOXYA12_FULL_35_11]|nr:MAG: NgoPII family restriction endonuclease [Bacteroidetes bacterium GWF2_35_48]OFY81565.1 MAG: NgoPII family restriction endonuclease [Bacteroidetes bacterium RIFOXYA12_FULL_35_11]OFY94417.1 MAG: NgoPII family restriction endonuclease [Bacteroidetes bacterium RIFOXYC12_FULL_35_7]OFY96263.1 MAG: NgoPII family restriction endonuclease [Bacteroidetes bacterium RIFOXYB2_FULL_35_7]HBX50446.1 NgoPII family restriction endonuclease [Bacteroidales bacterium]